MSKQIPLRDEEDLKSVTQNGNVLKVYDGGFGPLWLYAESLGVIGVMRAQTWEEAYEIAQDEFMNSVDDCEMEEWEEEFGENCIEDTCWQEQYCISPNNGFKHRDINGEWLWPLTYELCRKYRLTISAGRLVTMWIV